MKGLGPIHTGCQHGAGVDRLAHRGSWALWPGPQVLAVQGFGSFFWLWGMGPMFFKSARFVGNPFFLVSLPAKHEAPKKPYSNVKTRSRHCKPPW